MGLDMGVGMGFRIEGGVGSVIMVSGRVVSRTIGQNHSQNYIDSTYTNGTYANSAELNEPSAVNGVS